MDSTFSCCAYCWQDEKSWEDLLCFKCDGCGKRVHYNCIRSAQPSTLLHDTFYNFKCQACSDDGKEEFTRSNISWQNVVMLALYNLQKMGQGKCGYFHWKGHICAFIDQHWTTFFGPLRKKTTLWMGTVAGTLSSGCPEYFQSGTNVVEQGYWRLVKPGPPMPQAEKKKQKQKRNPPQVNSPVDLNPEERRCRKSREGALAAAIELKERRSAMVNIKGKKAQAPEHQRIDSKVKGRSSNKGAGRKSSQNKSKQRMGNIKDEKTGSPASITDFTEDSNMSDSQASATSSEQSSLASSSHLSYLHGLGKDDEGQRSSLNPVDPAQALTAIKMEAVESEDDFDIDIGMSATFSENLCDPRPSSPDFQALMNTDSEQSTSFGKSPVRKSSAFDVGQDSQSDDDSEGLSESNLNEESGFDDDEDGEESESDGQESTSQSKEELPKESWLVTAKQKQRVRHRKRRRLDEEPPPSPPPKLTRISVFEEGELLQKLNRAAALQPLKPGLAQLRRKLICNQTNREYGLPVFDLEKQMMKFAQADSSISGQTSSTHQLTMFPRLPSKPSRTTETRDLDRFMIHGNVKKVESRTYTRFRQRLVGIEDDELKPVVSPYTTRVLLPFIWRNYNTSRKPLKVKLLQEIQAYPHRNDPTWQAPPAPPIDYCYVRPEHIPSVNALCREFFWPGIDMSECLQYPDFSCVVLYRKIVIAFAFMVPDRGYNEAYISFIFTHPEWRGAGIATFMLYHLIQTCMGKDVLLHVSATNPAMLLYQKFGFKAQELSLNFYHKYFPLDAKDSLHAFLMRLSR